jgi:peptidoglycan-N-acetylglucosamine deacetylase
MIVALRRLAILLPLLAVGAQAAPLEVALTFDDLPSHGPLPASMSRADIAKAILAALRAHKAPYVYGFINGKRVDEVPADIVVLELWHQAGYALGNHGFSHMDLHKNAVADFMGDVAANEPLLHVFMGGQDWQWLRYPYLREGETLEKRRAVLHAVKERGYRVAEVTIDISDYAFNAPYVRCLAKGDGQAIGWMERAFLDNAAAAIDRAEADAQRVFGRDIRHVMLQHIGAFEVVMLPRLLDLLQQRGARLIRLSDAAADPAYQFDPDQVSANGATFLQLAAAAKQIPLPQPPNELLPKLDGLCR